VLCALAQLQRLPLEVIVRLARQRELVGHGLGAVIGKRDRR
jgi:hypothetical protein